MKTGSQRNLAQYVDHEVVDESGNKIGKLNCIWSDGQNEPVYLGVQTGWLFGKTHVVPAQRAEAKRYEGKVKEGNIFISVHSDNAEETRRAKEIFSRNGADDVAATDEEKVTSHAE